MDPEEVMNLYLAQFKNDLWIERRLKIDEIIECLQLNNNVQTKKTDHLSTSIYDFVEFFKYLKDQCSGLDFNDDKQWSELMNLMQISRKLNHKSVKLKDIVKNKQLIEASADDIRKLNERAKLCRNIGSMLNDLDSIIQKCSIELPSPTSDDSSMFILKQTLQTKRYVQDRCKPLLYTLKLEIDNELIAEESNLDTWSVKVQNLSDVIEKLESFSNNLYEFQFKLQNFRALMNIEEENSIKEEKEFENDEKELTNSLNLCKIKFKLIREVNTKLLESLYNLRNKFRSKTTRKENRQLLMINLLATSKDMTKFVDDLYDSQLRKALLDLDKCRMDLDRIMMNLRIEFGRFYFVNDIELLTIIALDSKLIQVETNNQNHLKGSKLSDADKQSLISKLFNNSIDGFIVNDNKFIVGVKNPLNEVILIQGDPIPIKKKVNIYSTEIVRILNECSRKLRKTLKGMLIKSLIDQTKENEIDWSLPIQLMNLAEHIKFCRRIECEFVNNKEEEANVQLFDSSLKFYESRFKKLVVESKQVESDPQKRRVNASNGSLDELKKSAAISLTVNFISIIVKLKSSRVKSANDWNWIKQVRYYFLNSNNADDQCVEVEIANARFKYRFDYLPIQADNIESGNNASFKRLISTQVTDKCIHVASQCISNFKLGANPYGPAGSGKTETIKALGHSLGCQVIVHNCTESNDSQSLEKLIFGLAHTGLWGCFDEFNRLSSSVLSTVSASLELVQTNLRESKTTIELANGKQIMSIDKNSAFFVTLNPGDETKYRGRRKLPVNLRNLFLPISMKRVEIDSIVGENLLILSGKLGNMISVNQSEVLLKSGHKFHLLIEWLKENINETRGRCEWDLRFVMAVLRRLKSIAMTAATTTKQQDVCLDIDNLLLESIRIELKPRLTAKEAELFHEGAAKIFNNCQIVGTDFGDSLEKARAKVGSISDMKYSSDVAKLVLDLQEQLSTRTGVMLLGEASTGKSTIWRLSQRLKGDSQVKWMAINPRSCQKRELFGFVDPSNNKWIDGLLTLKVREAISILQSNSSSSESNQVEQVWIVLDGPVDPDWIESLNSVMDDNQVLTLSSGERLDFYLASGKSIKLIFETTSIEFASPATISRLGLLYIEEPLNKEEFAGIKLDIYTEQLEMFKNHLVARNNSKVLEKSSLFEEFERSQSESKILIISGAANQATKSNFIAHNLDKQMMMEYCCSQYTNSTHFQDFLLEARNFPYLLIKNVQTTLAEDKQWRTSSFLELLRFMVTYNGYYDLNFNFQPLKHKFLLPLEHLDKLDPRILALSTALQITESEVQEVEPINVTSLQEFIISKFYLKYPILTVFSIGNKSLEQNDKELLLNQLGRVELFEFSNSRLVNDSLETLGQLLMENVLKNRTQDKGKLFILRELELRLLDERQKSILFHLLNKLKTCQLKPKVNFLYIILSNSNDRVNANNYEFFSSIGPICKLSGGKSRDISEFIQDKLKEETYSHGNVLKFDSVQKNWIVERLSKLFQQFKVSNLETIDHFMKFFISLIETLKSDLSSERKTLANGLNNLNRFEKVVDNIKSSCQVEESRLIEKKKEIDKLMKLLDKELKEAHEKREYIENLRDKQIVKTREIDENSRRIKQKLSKVEPLIESSKIEVAKYLKPEALNEIKSLRSPPNTIKDILDALFVLLGIRDSSWSSMKAHLTKYSIKDELTNYNFQKNLNKSLLSEVELIMRTKQESFNKQQAERASKAIVPILGWIEATLEYGKVLTSLRPLNEELARLRGESESLDREAQKIELETMEVDGKIQDYSGKIERLKEEFEESQRKANLVNEQLMKAQKVRIEMEDRIKKWRFKLESLELLLKGEQLIKLCLIATAIVMRQFDNFNLEELFKFFELKHFSREKFLATFLNLFEQEREFNEFSIKPEQTNRVLQLLLIKLCLNNNSGITNIPFINMNSSQNGSSETCIEKVVQFLSFDRILINDSKRTFILGPSQKHSSDWLQSIELSRKLNKLTLIELQNKPASFHLDIIDLIKSKSPTHQAGELKCILIGDLEDELCGTLKDMLRPIKLDEFNDDETTDCSIRSTILERLVKFYDPKLSKSVERLESELMSKQINAKSMEKDLLKQLASAQASSEGDNENGNELQNDLVKILSELYQLSSSLEKDLNDMRDKLGELRLKQQQYFKQADKAARFYKHFIADLYKMDKFYHMSLNSYIEELLVATTMKNSDDVDVNNYQVIINKVLLSMRCQDRLIFSNKLKNGDQEQERQQIVAFDVNVTQKMAEFGIESLKKILTELVLTGTEETKKKFCDTGRKTTLPYKLAIVMHDPTKSSPQAEIDELFRKQEFVVTGGEKIACYYSKIYATGEGSPEHLEFELRKLSSKCYDDDMSVKRSHGEHLSNNGSYYYPMMVKCLCVTNAHLSADWLNSHLLEFLPVQVDLLESGEPSLSANSSSTNIAVSNTRILPLVILVAEKEVKTNVFSEEILDFANIRYWHDELALNLTDRYEQFSRSMLYATNKDSSFLATTNSTTTCDAGGKANSSEILLVLAKQLILFHVVCQELTKPCKQNDATATMTTKQDHLSANRRLLKEGWKNKENYNFDYDLLCLAFKTLKLLWEQFQSKQQTSNNNNNNNNNGNLDMKQFRLMFCDYLKNIVYGSRMENLEDELRLNSLIERIISSPKSGEDQLNKLEQLKFASKSVIEYDRLLANLIDDRF